MDWEIVINHIPRGSKETITKETLIGLTGYTDREIRKAVEEARRNGVRVVSSSHRRGYYIATEQAEWDAFLLELKNRIRTTMETYNKCSKNKLVIKDEQQTKGETRRA